jgi:hypothetical protein
LNFRAGLSWIIFSTSLNRLADTKVKSVFLGKNLRSTPIRGYLFLAFALP